MVDFFDKTYFGKKVYITGITGFKGSWLAQWMKLLGAEVHGFALAPETRENHFSLLNIENYTQIGDILDLDSFANDIKNFQPDIVFHLAAQSLVRKSYADPVATYATNVMGTLNVLEACRHISSIKAVVIITSDKVYENKESGAAYNEKDELGGYDLYSSSKACAEILVRSYRNSFFHISEFGKNHHTLIATVRAGNVIGGGDWAPDRLVPDIISASNKNERIRVRNPDSVRPWQHVLDPLSGYMQLGAQLLQGNTEFADAWNFGPDQGSVKTVDDLLAEMRKTWNKISVPDYSQAGSGPHEAKLLSVDSSKAKLKLKWAPIWNFADAVKNTTNWYKNHYEKKELMTINQIENYCNDAIKDKSVWAK